MTFTFTDSQERTYPDILVDGAVLVAEPGQSYDLDADPADGRWTTSASPFPRSISSTQSQSCS